MLAIIRENREKSIAEPGVNAYLSALRESLLFSRNPEVVVGANVGEDVAECFLRRFQRCFSERDCYPTILFDDIARNMMLRFDDGSEVFFDEPFAYGDLEDGDHDVTAFAIGDFVRENFAIPDRSGVFF